MRKGALVTVLAGLGAHPTVAQPRLVHGITAGGSSAAGSSGGRARSRRGAASSGGRARTGGRRSTLHFRQIACGGCGDVTRAGGCVMAFMRLDAAQPSPAQPSQAKPEHTRAKSSGEQAACTHLVTAGGSGTALRLLGTGRHVATSRHGAQLRLPEGCGVRTGC